MSHLNGHGRVLTSFLQGRDLIAEARQDRLVANVTTSRSELFRRVFDPRRDVYDECGYPRGYVTPQLYQDLYDREAVAARVVEVLPKESFQVQPDVYEDEDPDTDTPFELAWKELSANLSPLKSWHEQEKGSVVWEYLLRADVLSGIGQYGVIFLGLNDGLELSMPAAGVEEVNSFPRAAPGAPKGHGTATAPGSRSPAGSQPSTGAPAAVGGAGNGTRPGLPPTDLPPALAPDQYGNPPGYQGTQAQTGPGGVSMGSGYPPSGTPDHGPPGPGYPVQYGDVPQGATSPTGARPVGASDNPGSVAAAEAPTEASPGSPVPGASAPSWQGAAAHPPGTLPQSPAGVGSLVSPGQHGLPAGHPAVGSQQGVLPGGAGQPTVTNPPAGAGHGVRGPGVTPQPAPTLSNPAKAGDGSAPDGGPPLAKARPAPVGNTYTDDGEYRLTVNAEETAGRKLLYLRAFPESLARVTQFEANRTSPRFGMPVMYLITLNDPTNWPAGSAIGASTISVNVHWTRVIHVVDNSHQATASEVAAAPRMRPVLNNLLNLQKLYGAGAEGYWKSCFTGMSLETNPQLGGDVIVDKNNLRDMVEQYQNGLQRWMVLTGMSAKPLAPAVIDPTPHIASNIEAICIKGGYPVRVFKGSERGELASSMDDGQWNDRLRERQHNYITPRIVAPFVDRLIMLGVLPEPEKYRVEWPDLEAQTADQKSKNALSYAQAMSSYALIPDSATPDNPTKLDFLDFLVHVLDWDKDLARQVIENAKASAAAAQKAQMDQAQQQAQAMIDQGVDPQQAAIASGLHGGPPVGLGQQAAWQNPGQAPPGQETGDAGSAPPPPPGKGGPPKPGQPPGAGSNRPPPPRPTGTPKPNPMPNPSPKPAPPGGSA